MLAGKGFNQVINMAGGIKAWNSQIAVGGQDQGLELFTGKESPQETLVVAYSLEAGLRNFYLSMIEKVQNVRVQDLFQKLSQIERIHQDRIFDEYLQISESDIDREAFDRDLVVKAVEGGLTTEEYIERYRPDWNSATDIISLAMSIEAQALDLYTRASENSQEERSKTSLKKIAEEERVHLQQLGELIDSL
jgi:rubrerythrin